MCGIVGFTGRQQAAPILLEGLAKLEYRGYDSAGLAVRDGERLAVVVKTKGRLSNLVEKTDSGNALKGTCGIGHTRWATHGEPSVTNAHPHVAGNCTGSGSGAVESAVVGVHNGIIENYQELREKLSRHGYVFYSQTDTEVVIKLVDYYYKKYQLGPIDAIAKTMVRVRGSYALELMFTDYPGEIWVARKDSPMIIGITDGETYVASDVPAILKYTRNVYYIDNLEFAKLTPGQAVFYDLNGDEVQKDTVEIKWDAEAAEKAGFEHFMIKEIHEQPKAVADTLRSVMKNDRIDLSGIGLSEERMQKIRQIYMVACGSAWHGIHKKSEKDLHCGLRLLLPCGSRGKIQSGAAAAPPGGCDAGLRISLSKDAVGSGVAGDRYQSVRRDGRYTGSPSSGQGERH